MESRDGTHLRLVRRNDKLTDKTGTMQDKFPVSLSMQLSRILVV